MLRKTTSAALMVALILVVAVSSLLSTMPGEASPISATNRTLQAQRVASPITIDADLSDWPSIPALYLDALTAQYVGGTVKDAADLSLSIFSAWDDQFLYVGAVITDDTLIADSSNVWDDDSLEIALDGANDGRCCGADDHQLTVTLDRRQADFGVVVRSESSPMRVAVTALPRGYRLELAIPLTSLTGMPVLSGTVMGVNAGANDDDDGGRRDKRLVWVGNSTLDFSNLGSLVFSGITPATATRTATTAAGASSTPTTVPAATATRTATAPALPTATRSATAPPTATATATRVPPGQPTPSLDERLQTLENHLATLEGRIRSILDLLQRAGRLPVGAIAPGAAAIPSPAQVTDPLAYMQAVNCGGEAYTTISGHLYAADQQYSPGSWGYLSGQVAQAAQAIANTDDDPLYQVERYNTNGYAFTVPAGTYDVTMRLAEIYPYIVARGRVFDVKIEEQTVVKDLEVLARVGQYAALDLTFTVVVTDGQLDIAFLPTAGVATFNAIVVKGIGFSGPTPTPSTGDRLGAASAKLTELEAMVLAIVDIFRTTRPDLATATPLPTLTVTPTATSAPRTPTQILTPSTPTATRTATLAFTRTPTPGGATATPRTTAKKGVGGGERPELLREVGVSWSYIWYVAANNFNSAYEHVPMIWGKDYDATVVTQVARSHPGSYWLIWNEPDYWQQANISPVQAAQLYRTLRPLIKGADPAAKLIVGGVFNLNVGWISSFRAEYYRLYNEWPVVEGWHVHHYAGGPEDNATTWRERLQAVRDWMPGNGGMVELWLTEFGCLNNDAIAAQIMSEQTPWLEAQPWVTRYAWYAAFAVGPTCPSCTGSLFNADGSLTQLGLLYRRLP